MQVTKKYQELNLLLVGCGSIGKRHAQVLTELGMTKMTACDPSETQRNAMKELFPQIEVTDDYDAALATGKFDAVFIFTPTAMHLDMLKRALDANCHVFVEKPLANTCEGVAELRELAQKKGLLVMVGFCLRYHEVLLRAKELLDSGIIGRLINIRAFVGEPFYEIQPNYKNMYYAKYSGAFELVHDIDLALWFGGQPVRDVYGVYGAFSDMEMAPEAPDSVELLIGFEDRLAANVHLDFYLHPRRRQIELMGVKGTIIVEFSTWDHATLSCYTTDTREWSSTTYETQRNDMFRDEDEDFLLSVVGERELTLTIDEALRSLDVVERVYQIPEIYKK